MILPSPRCLHSNQGFKTTKSELIFDPYWLVGFVDGEGSFMLSMYDTPDSKSGLHLTSSFAITLHEKDAALLYAIQSFFGVGSVRPFKKNKSVTYSVTSLQDLVNVIIPFFVKYPLLTQKQADFLLFKSIVELMSNKEHLNPQGLIKIVSLKAVLNRGLNETLSKRFPDVIPAPRPLVETTEIPDGNWLAGFTDAEGCFSVNVTPSKTNVGFAVKLRFRLTQHVRDSKLLQVIVNHFLCGKLCTEPRSSGMRLDITRLSDILVVIKPLFNKYPLLGSKRLDYVSFIEVVDMMERKEHLAQEGLDRIRLIKAGMNTGRDYPL